LAITRLRTTAVADGHLGRHPDNGNVELAARCVPNVRAATAWPGRGDDHLDEHFVRRELRAPHTDEKLGCRNAPATARAGNHQLRVERQQGWRHVRRGRCVG
jgi:hypothetical protein